MDTGSVHLLLHETFDENIGSCPHQSAQTSDGCWISNGEQKTYKELEYS